MNLSNKGNDLGEVVMPLIRVMGAGNLSWSNRVEIARVIMECWRHHKSMEDEARAHASSAAQGQMAQRLGGLA